LDVEIGFYGRLKSRSRGKKEKREKGEKKEEGEISLMGSGHLMNFNSIVFWSFLERIYFCF